MRDTKKNNRKGQVFVEFVLLLTILISLGLTLRSFTNSYIKDYWYYATQIIMSPNPKLHITPEFTN